MPPSPNPRAGRDASCSAPRWPVRLAPLGGDPGRAAAADDAPSPRRRSAGARAPHFAPGPGA